MKLLSLNSKEKTLKIMPESLDDLWHLEKIIEKEDIIKGLTSRRIKAEEGRESFRQTFYMELDVKDINYDDFTGVLRVNGLVLAAKPMEFIELNSYQGIEIKLFEPITLVKKKWREHQIKLLKKIIQASALKPFVIVLIDDEQADIALLREFKFELKITIRGSKQGKVFLQEDKKEKHFNEILQKLVELKTEKIIIAGPGFVKEDLSDFLESKDFKPKVFLASTGHVGITGLNELLLGKESQKLFRELEVISQGNYFNEFLMHLGKNDGLALYGTSRIEEAVQMRAVKTILITDKFFAEKKEESDILLTEAEKLNAVVKIIPSKTELGEKIDSFDGLVAVLRFKPF